MAYRRGNFALTPPSMIIFVISIVFAVILPKDPSDPSLAVFRATLADIARKKDSDALPKLVAREFFWERDFGGGFDKKKSPFINFATALNLAAADNSGWRYLEAFAE